MESEGDQGNVGNVCGWRSLCKVRGVLGMYVGRCKVFGEVRGMPGEYMGWMQSTRGIPEGSICWVDTKCLGTQGEC